MLAAGPAKVLRPERPCSAGRAAIVVRGYLMSKEAARIIARVGGAEAID